MNSLGIIILSNFLSEDVCDGSSRLKMLLTGSTIFGINIFILVTDTH